MDHVHYSPALRRFYAPWRLPFSRTRRQRDQRPAGCGSIFVFVRFFAFLAQIPYTIFYCGLLPACRVFFQDQPLPGDPVWQGPYAVIFVFFLLTAVASLLTAIVLTIHAVGKTKLPFSKWVPVVYAVFLIAYTVILVEPVARFSAGNSAKHCFLYYRDYVFCAFPPRFCIFWLQSVLQGVLQLFHQAAVQSYNT